jgi:hypothetical protein
MKKYVRSMNLKSRIAKGVEEQIIHHGGTEDTELLLSIQFSP